MTETSEGNANKPKQVDQTTEAPQKIEAGESQLGASLLKESSDATKKASEIQVSAEQFGEKDAKTINDYMKGLASGAVPLYASSKIGDEYHHVKSDLENQVIKGNGINPKASDQEVMKLITLLGVEAAATKQYIGKLEKSHGPAKYNAENPPGAQTDVGTKRAPIRDAGTPIERKYN